MKARRLLALLALSTGTASAAPGETSFELLRLETGARESAMGRAGVALHDEAGMGEANPATLSTLAGQAARFSYHKFFDDLGQGAAGYARPTDRYGHFAVELQQLDYGSIKGSDPSGLPTGSVQAADRGARLAWSMPRDGFSPGVALKLVQQSLAGVTAQTQAADIGFLWRPRVRNDSLTGRLAGRTSIGFAARNLGGGASFEKAKEKLPTSTALGLSHRAFADGLVLSLEAEKARVRALAWRVGTELWLKGTVALRAGFRTDDDAGAGVTGGVGVKVGSARLDYAFVPADRLGDAHRVTLSFRFGRSLADRHYEEGLRQLQRGNPAEAILHFDKALLVDPKDRRVLEKAREAANQLRRELAPQTPKK
jgi:hypothetical protein